MSPLQRTCAAGSSGLIELAIDLSTLASSTGVPYLAWHYTRELDPDPTPSG